MQASFIRTSRLLVRPIDLKQSETPEVIVLIDLADYSQSSATGIGERLPMKSTILGASGCDRPLARSILVGLLALALTCLSGCATDSPHRKTLGGATVGAAAGAIIGALVGGEDGAAIGALIGAAAGGLIGAQLDAEDQRKRQAALGLAATQPPGSTAEWSSPTKGTSGQVARVGDLFTVDGRQCMQVQETISIKGKPESVTDTRCLDGNGEWVAQAT